MFKSVNSSNLGQVSKSNIVLIFILKFMILPITPDIGYPYADVDVASSLVILKLQIHYYFNPRCLQVFILKHH